MRRVVYLATIILLVACTSPNQDISQNIRLNLEISSTDAPPTPQLDIVTPVPTQITPRPGASGPADFPPGVNPLTGLAVEDPDVLDRRPIVVKISNAPPLVRPQSGVGAADLVFEHYAEGGLTRFSAVFYSNTPERVGSIRSARLIDHELVPMFDGILAFAGASIGVEKFIYGSDDVEARIDGAENTPPLGYVPPSEYSERAYKGVLYGQPYYRRDEIIPVPHNLFVNLAALWELAAEEGHDQRPDLNGLTFFPEPPEDSDGAIHMIDIRYRATRVRWEYDAESGLYQRFADGQGHYDANTEEQITAANVVVIYAGHSATDIIESQFEGSIAYSTSIAVWGQGDAVLFRDGQRYNGRWVRDQRDEIIGLRTREGGFLYLKPGQTWFQIMRPPFEQDPEEEWLRTE